MNLSDDNIIEANRRSLPDKNLLLADLPLAREAIQYWAEIVINCVPVNLEFLARRLGVLPNNLVQYLEGHVVLDRFVEYQLSNFLKLLIDPRVDKCFGAAGPYILVADESFDSMISLYKLCRELAEGGGYSYELVSNCRSVNDACKHIVLVTQGDITICRIPSWIPDNRIQKDWPSYLGSHSIDAVSFDEIMTLVDQEINDKLACTWDSNISYINDDYSELLIL